MAKQQSEYTKGEWLVHEWGNKYQVVEAQARIGGRAGIIMSGQRIIAKEITKANANLIAKSPKMYELLDEVRQNGLGHCGVEWFNRVVQTLDS